MQSSKSRMLGLLMLFVLATAGWSVATTMSAQAQTGGYTKLRVQNRTGYPIVIFVNGGQVGSVAPRGTYTFTVPSGYSALKAVGPRGGVRTRQRHYQLRPGRMFTWTIN